jgi:hypothetical protein
VASLGTPTKDGAGWLYGPGRDLFVLLVPWLAAAAFALPQHSSSPDASLAVWTSQFVLGNTTHVILTFLLLAVRRDVLHATPTQARTVVIGSLVTFAAVFGLLRGVGALAPAWIDFPLAVLAIFGSHHRLSQAKGIWSLYNLRASTLGDGPPSGLERSLQQAWVALGMIVVMVTWLFVPTGEDRMFPLLQAIPNEPAFLPRWVAYALAGAWATFALVALAAMARARSRIAKLVHVGSHGAAVTFAILSPAWGAVVWGALHGLEYYFLSARMLAPADGEAPSLGTRLAIPMMLLAMAPLLFVGLATAPFASGLVSAAISSPALTLTNACVVAHYFADAFIYRFRIPAVRKVALTRLGFGAPPRPSPAPLALPETS